MKNCAHIIQSMTVRPYNQPTEADIRAFMQSGGDYHIIVRYPYDITSWACYDKVGDLRQLDVIRAMKFLLHYFKALRIAYTLPKVPNSC